MCFRERFHWSTCQCKIISLSSKSRTDRYDFSKKLKLLSFPVKHSCDNTQMQTSKVRLDCLSHQCGKPVKPFYPFFFSHLWLPGMQSFQQFSSGGLSSFSRAATGAWHYTNLWGPAGESSYVRKALSIGLCNINHRLLHQVPGITFFDQVFLSEPQPGFCHI